MIKFDKLVDIAIHNNKIISTVVILVVFYLLRFITYKLIDYKSDNVRRKFLVRQTITYVAITLLIISLFVVWVDWFRSILTFLSLVIGALILTAKEYILNLLGYTIIIWRSLFQVGDRIQIGNYIGDVIETGPMYISLSEIGNWIKSDDYTGRIIKIPNSQVITQTISNYSFASPIIWEEFEFKTQIDADYQTIRKVTLEVLNKYHHFLTREDLHDIENDKGDLMFFHKEPEVFINLEDNFIKFTCRFTCRFTRRRMMQNQIFTDLIGEFQKLGNIEVFKID